MSFRLRLNILVTALMVILSFVALGMLMLNARTQVAAEVESTTAIVHHLINSNTQLFDDIDNFNQYPVPFVFQGAEHLRHLRVEVYDAQGQLKYSNITKKKSSYSQTPPEWFVLAVTTSIPKPIKTRKNLISNGKMIGVFDVSPDPSYEVQEVWNDTFDFFVLYLVFFIIVNLILYWAVSKALKPIDAILEALNALENGRLDARLPSFELPELTSISAKFNLMADSLEKSIANNHELSNQLIQLQEEERRLIARDLHDELGQYLIAIRTEANTLLEINRNKSAIARDSAQAIVDSTMDLMVIVRQMLQRLRPDVLDKLGLNPAILELVGMWRERYAHAVFISKIPKEIPRLEDQLSISVYRFVQEGLTNIAKHARATRVELEVREEVSHQNIRQLIVKIQDNGVGFDVEQANGFGLRGMKERILGLGGKLHVQSQLGQGATVLMVLPISHFIKGDGGEYVAN